MPTKPFEPYTPERITNVVKRLDRLSGRLRAVAAWMDEQGASSLQVTNHKSMVKGLEFSEAFGYAAERAVDNERLTELDKKAVGRKSPVKKSPGKKSPGKKKKKKRSRG